MSQVTLMDVERIIKYFKEEGKLTDEFIDKLEELYKDFENNYDDIIELINENSPDYLDLSWIFRYDWATEHLIVSLIKEHRGTNYDLKDRKGVFELKIKTKKEKPKPPKEWRPKELRFIKVRIDKGVPKEQVINELVEKYGRAKEESEQMYNKVKKQ